MTSHCAIFCVCHIIRKERKESSGIAMPELCHSCLLVYMTTFLSACVYKKKNRSRIDAEPSFILAINNIPPWIHEQMEGKASSISLRDAFPITFYTCMNAKFSLKLEYIVSCYYILIVS